MGKLLGTTLILTAIYAEAAPTSATATPAAATDLVAVTVEPEHAYHPQGGLMREFCWGNPLVIDVQPEQGPVAEGARL